MSLAVYVWGYLGALLAVGVLDGLWLGVVARSFYQVEMAPVAADNFKLVPAALFYFLYPLGILALALTPAASGWPEALVRSALLGLVVYGVYDLTNMATLKAWSLQLAVVDAAWGAFVTGMAGLSAHAVMVWASAPPAQ